jgi:magnesium transporter
MREQPELDRTVIAHGVASAWTGERPCGRSCHRRCGAASGLWTGAERIDAGGGGDTIAAARWKDRGSSMLRILVSDDGHLRPIAPAEETRLPAHTVWIDLHQPSRDEEAFLERALGISLPTKEDMQEIEPSSRLYRENGAMFMTANVVWKADTPEPENTPVTFVLANDLLVTIRYGDPRAFGIFAAHAERNHALCASAPEVLVNLLDAIVDRMADILERIGSDVDGIARLIMRRGGAANRRRVPTEAL